MGDVSPSEVETVTLGRPGPDARTAHALPPGTPARRAGASAQAAGPQMSQQIALATLREEEADTARTMIRVGRLVGTAALIPLPLLGGSEALRVAMLIAVVVAIVVGWIVERRIDTAPSETTMVTLAISVSPGISIGMLYFGIFSAAQLFPALALYFFARRESLPSALALYALNALAQAAFATLVITGVVEDPGLVRAGQTPQVLAISHLLLQIGFLGAFLLGRGSHRAARDAIVKMQTAMRLAAQREALLHEARQDLDRALRIDAPGRFTEHVFGDYRLGHVIGRGGMGEVYEAVHVKTGDAAAVKLLAHRELGNPQSVERFVREVRAVRGLASPHVVRVLAASGEHDEIPYLVMERLHGHDLAHHLRAGRRSPGELDEMLAQVGVAIEAAWAQGIVHRDLKPKNLFLAEDDGPPTWKVLDFGVAALDEHSGTLTEGKVIGTPAYMAPEQARGERVDHRADVYALAAIAYRWLTGRPVCAGKDLHNALYQAVHVMPQPPTSFADLHVDVDAVLAIGLAKRSADRWDSVAELRDALARALAGKLDPRTRRRAADLLAHHPWGAVRD